MDKICIVVTGMASAGKTYFANQLVDELSKDYLQIGYLDLPSHCLYREEDLKNKINDIFTKTGVVILIIETHPPYLFNLDDYKTLYLHFRLPFLLWKKNNPLEKETDFKFNKVMSFDDIVKKCVANHFYYHGVVDIYECICMRGEYKNKISTWNIKDGISEATKFVSKNLKPNAQEKIKQFFEYAKKPVAHLGKDYLVFQYQTFDYGQGMINIGMSDPYFKWDNILKMNKVNILHKRLLDIGSNVGEITYLAASKGAKATGIEYDKEFYDGAMFLQENLRKHPCNFIWADFMEYEFKEKFDVVMALATLYMLYDKYTIQKVFEKIRSITNEVFVAELTYNETNRDKILDCIRSLFSKVEFIGNSMRTSTDIKKYWNERNDYTETRQVWHCYI